ncbi:unnamed protein product [Dovyalis caffra]|uniref:Uncharacterized protein n=1 Tax=Dovyalis caffra TaxID=77055 RepID=A0AAV1QR50_9ROSI|nr:unnamed protein product [Dovyalis caffra]
MGVRALKNSSHRSCVCQLRKGTHHAIKVSTNANHVEEKAVLLATQLPAVVRLLDRQDSLDKVCLWGDFQTKGFMNRVCLVSIKDLLLELESFR